MMIRAYAFAAAFGGAIVAIAMACSDSTLPTFCTQIPDGGCPGQDSHNCSDTAHCAAIYECQSGTAWTFVQKCPGYAPPRDAGHDAGFDAVGAADGESGVDAPLRDAGFPLPPGAGGGPGCEDLESPDCPLELAVQCGAYCCGCETLYVCADGGWNAWGQCDDAGAIVENPQP